jgi:SAM-dependent methyltransferase
MGRALDPESLRYADHWEPVLAGAARRTLDRLDTAPARLLDLGAGTGSLILAALRRWPSAHVLAVDASNAMLGVARSRVPRPDAARVTWLSADAADLPIEDAAVDAAVCSFVLQLVADRPTVLAELRRVLQPGGTLSCVTWLADDLVLPADAAYHEVMGDLDEDDEDGGFRSPRSGDYLSLQQAHDELADARFESVEVSFDELRFAWTPETYLAFKEGYDDHERLATLDVPQRERLHTACVERLATLSPRDFEVRGPLVAAVARKPLDEDQSRSA